jgi:hypothetical protein
MAGCPVARPPPPCWLAAVSSPEKRCPLPGLPEPIGSIAYPYDPRSRRRENTRSR